MRKSRYSDEPIIAILKGSRSEPQRMLEPMSLASSLAEDLACRRMDWRRRIPHVIQ